MQQSSVNGHAQLRSKLTINQPGDAFEQEANVAAGRVMKDVHAGQSLNRSPCGSSARRRAMRQKRSLRRRKNQAK